MAAKDVGCALLWNTRLLWGQVAGQNERALSCFVAAFLAGTRMLVPGARSTCCRRQLAFIFTCQAAPTIHQLVANSGSWLHLHLDLT
jgi:hypothetical protein